MKNKIFVKITLISIILTSFSPFINCKKPVLKTTTCKRQQPFHKSKSEYFLKALMCLLSPCIGKINETPEETSRTHTERQAQKPFIINLDEPIETSKKKETIIS